MKAQIKLLRASPFNESIYNSAPTKDLIESIKEKGILQAIWITEDNMIIAGHRRVNACKELGIEEIEAEIREYSDWLVIESNRYREKTLSEKLREAEALEKIWRERGREKQKQAGENYGRGKEQLLVNLPKPKKEKSIDTRSQISEAIGMSEKTYAQAKAIKEEAPELIEAIDKGNKTIHGTYRLLKKKKMKNELKAKNFPSDKKIL